MKDKPSQVNPRINSRLLNREFIRRFIFTVVICLGFTISKSGFADISSKVQDINVENNSVVISLTSSTESRSFVLKNPSRIVLDIADCFLIGESKKIPVGSGAIDSVRIAQNSSNPFIVRVVVDLAEDAPYKILNSQNNITVQIGPQKLEPEKKVEISQRQSTQIQVEEIILVPKTITAEAMLSAPNQPAQDEEVKREYIKIVPSENINIPSLIKYRGITLQICAVQLKIEKKPVFVNNTLMVQASQLFGILSCEAVYKTKEKQLDIRKEGQIKASFEINDIKCSINGEDRILDCPPKLIKGKVYVPLISIVKYFGYGAVWNLKTKTIYVNPRITDIKYISEGDLDKITISSSHLVNIKNEEYKENPIRLIFTIPGSMVDLKGKSLKIGQGDIGKADIIQDRNDSNLVVYLNKTIFYHVKTIENENKINITFPPTIIDMKITEETESVNILIKASKPINPVFKTLKDPDRIIIDVPNSMYKSTYLLPVDKGSVERIRGSQFKDEPLVSRIVIDLTQKGEYETETLAQGKILKVKVLRPEAIVRREKAKRYAIFKNKVIVIDPGHGGRDPGAFGYSGSKEKEYNLKTSLILNSLFLDAGAISQLTREDDTYVSLDDRVNFAENHNADIFISFHYNALDRSSMSGTETYYYSDHSKDLAQFIQKSIVSCIKRDDRGVRKVKFYTISKTSMPAVLVEPAYITNRDEEDLIKDKKFEEEVSLAIFEGVRKYLEGRKGR